MRLLYVSAHYPPNFVSGGTLVPQRLATGLQRRGHDVRVFAGHLGERPALQMWEEQVGNLPVQWVSITPYTQWGTAYNHDNPDVAALFADYLRRVRPEVVHFHALQAMGAGLLAPARISGARVVVTMHDYWWLCGRQFLVTRDRKPCCLVTDCGLCPCEVDHSWLRERDAWLRDALRHADLVLAPSTVTAKVLAANGIDPNALRVDENGLPTAPPEHAPAPHAEGAPVRLLFAGGPDPLKGLPVLRRALRRLADLSGWSLSAYGCTAAEVDLPGLPVTALPAYAPRDLNRVLSAHDVLVLPSLARESFSIITREALSAGLAVVTSDTLGPEEVVRHGENGLVVPAGDDLVLADALRHLVEEPQTMQDMRRRGLPTPVRTLEEQLDGLERTYTELLATRPRGRDGVDVKRVLFVAGITGAPLRYRARLPAEALALLGVSSDIVHYRDPDLPRLAALADAVVFYRVPATEQLLSLVDEIRERIPAVPLIYDIDDLVFDDTLGDQVRGLAALPRAEIELWWQGVRRYRTMLEACDAYIGSTLQLCARAEEVAGIPAHRWRNGVGVLLSQASDAAVARPRTAGPVRLGYFSGTKTHDHDWAAIEPAVLEVLRRHPDIELWLGGFLTPTPALGPFAGRVRRLPFLPWDRLPSVLRDVDVNLVPLELDSQFNDAKSAIKWLEAALVATPSVASPTQPFRESVDDGETGFLANSTQEWVTALDRLVEDIALRRRVGERARRAVLLETSPHLQGRRYLDILQGVRDQVRAHGHRQSTSGFQPVALDEPYEQTELDPYEWTGTAAHRVKPGRRVRSGLAAVRRDGAVATVARAARTGLSAARR